MDDKHSFKLPFTEREKQLIDSRLDFNIFLARKIILSHEEEFSYVSPFKTEHLIRDKTLQDKKDNVIFENIRDKSKYTFTYKFNKMTPDDTNKTNKTSLHKKMSKNEIQKLSKGSFKYLIRTYSIDMFEQHIKRLEKAKSLFSKEQIKEAQSNFFLNFLNHLKFFIKYFSNPFEININQKKIMKNNIPK